MSTDPTRVVIAGGGIAAAELVLALADLAGDRVDVTLVSLTDELTMKPFRAGEPFTIHARSGYPLSALAERTGATIRIDAVSAVSPGEQVVTLESGDTLDYDVLVVAVGARSVNPYGHALTFRGDRVAIPFNGLLSDLEQGYTKSVGFIVPPGVTWPLPMYELALMTAREVRTMGITPDMTFVTPERRPLEVFGPAASTAVTELFAQADIVFVGDTEVTEIEFGVFATAGDRPLEVERVVTIPVLEGIAIPGVPTDNQGFIPVDEHCRVRGLANAFAAGDGTGGPVKQGGVACQQADAIAEQIAQLAGADVEPQPFSPVLRGRLLTGKTVRYMSDRDPEGGEAEQPALFAAHRKVDGRYLSPWIAELDGIDPAAHDEEPPTSEHVAIDVDVQTLGS